MVKQIINKMKSKLLYTSRTLAALTNRDFRGDTTIAKGVLHYHFDSILPSDFTSNIAGSITISKTCKVNYIIKSCEPQHTSSTGEVDSYSSNSNNSASSSHNECFGYSVIIPKHIPIIIGVVTQTTSPVEEVMYRLID